MAAVLLEFGDKEGIVFTLDFDLDLPNIRLDALNDPTVTKV